MSGVWRGAMRFGVAGRGGPFPPRQLVRYTANTSARQHRNPQPPPYSERYNHGQLGAIRVAAVGSPGGITLLQGPPGSGKTRTVVGVVSAFLAGGYPRNGGGGGGDGPRPRGLSYDGGAGTKIIPGAVLGGSMARSSGTCTYRNASPRLSRLSRLLRLPRLSRLPRLPRLPRMPSITVLLDPPLLYTYPNPTLTLP